MHGLICVKSDNTPFLFLIYCGAAGQRYISVLASSIANSGTNYDLHIGQPANSPSRTIEAMAFDLIQDIVAMQPNGPYRLAGWSFGGMLAYEVSIQLIGADHVVEFLGMLDTHTYYELDDHELYYRDAISDMDALNFMNEAWPDCYEKLQAINGNQSCLPSLDNNRIKNIEAYQNVPSNTHDSGSISTYALASMNYSAHAISIPICLFASKATFDDHPMLGWESVLSRHLISMIPTTGTPNSRMTVSHLDALGRDLLRMVIRQRHTSVQMHEHTYSPLIPLQTGNRSQYPLLCIPGAGGSVTSFVELIGCLDQSVPVLGLQPRGMNSSMVPHSTVAAAAISYCRAVEKELPGQPVHLLGHSFGGFIALEMARQFTRAGRVVASLTIVDTEAPSGSGDTWPEYSSTDIVMEWVDVIELMLRRSINLGREDITSLNRSEQLGLVHNRLVQAGLMPPQSSPESLDGPLWTFASCLRARFISDQQYMGSTSLLVARDLRLSDSVNHQQQENTIAKWRSCLPKMTAHYSIGDHFSILKVPLVRELAEILHRRLKR
jgi:thioesterase domain-containing protein